MTLCYVLGEVFSNPFCVLVYYFVCLMFRESIFLLNCPCWWHISAITTFTLFNIKNIWYKETLSIQNSVLYSSYCIFDFWRSRPRGRLIMTIWQLWLNWWNFCPQFLIVDRYTLMFQKTYFVRKAVINQKGANPVIM